MNKTAIRFVEKAAISLVLQKRLVFLNDPWSGSMSLYKPRALRTISNMVSCEKYETIFLPLPWVTALKFSYKSFNGADPRLTLIYKKREKDKSSIELTMGWRNSHRTRCCVLMTNIGAGHTDVYNCLALVFELCVFGLPRRI